MSPLVTFSEMDALGTIAKGYMWELVIPTLPAGISIPNGAAVIRQRVRSASIPQRSFEPLIDSFQGLEIADTGAPTYTHDWACTFTETTEGWILRAMEQWLNLSYDPETGIGALKADRVVDILLNLLNDKGEAYMGYKLKNAQPRTNTDGTTLSYEDKAAKVEVPVTWLYDYYIPVF